MAVWTYIHRVLVSSDINCMRMVASGLCPCTTSRLK
ncbi:hypothetical protein SEEN6803_23047 [Salmonella enterica subsp. enterica serovar Newport str. 36803]|nr:hypothetical protein SEEN6803_23047 [Salmonella enterica subsp. enterica serovar Newport str. 36803]